MPRFYTKPKANCENCDKEFFPRSHGDKGRARFCSKRCSGIFHQAPIDYDAAKKMYEAGMTMKEIGEKLNVNWATVQNLFHRKKLKLRHGSRRKGQCWQKNVKYNALHARVIAMRGTPSKCEKCGVVKGRFDWANLTGNYYDVNDFIRLCRLCHSAMDRERRNKTGKTTSGHVPGGWKSRREQKKKRSRS